MEILGECVVEMDCGALIVAKLEVGKGEMVGERELEEVEQEVTVPPAAAAGLTEGVDDKHKEAVPPVGEREAEDDMEGEREMERDTVEDFVGKTKLGEKVTVGV